MANDDFKRKGELPFTPEGLVCQLISVRQVVDSLGNVYQVKGNRQDNVRFAFGIVLR